MVLETVNGQLSWRVTSANVEAWVTQLGGMLAPVQFDMGDRVIQPFSVAPWCDESIDAPEVIQALRGDFFCLPFGNDEAPFLGETHPLHGEPANGEWQFDNVSGSTLDLVFESKVRPSKTYKTVRCGDGVVYHRNTVLGLNGPMCYGLHAMLAFNSPGLLAFSSVLHPQVFPGQFENAAQGGYSCLAIDHPFRSLEFAPLAAGGTTDLTSYPAREGYEDLVQFAADPVERLAWAAVTFQEERYAYFQLKNSRVLNSTLLWFSNGGRHYAPWSGRHRGVLGIEEVTSYFHLGLRGSVSPNTFQAEGVKTFRDCHPSDPLDVRSIFGVLDVPEGFERVAAVVPSSNGVVFVDRQGMRIEKQLDLLFLGVQ